MSASFEEHPIFNNSQFFIHTPMITALRNEITRCLWNGISGSAVYGTFRIGKTRALMHLMDQFTNCMGERIPARYISVAPRDVGTIAGVFKNICHALGFELKTKATADDMANLILHHLGELSLSNSTRQVILIVDELQRLNVSQFEAFAELYDGLVGVGANLFVLFAGNDAASDKLIKSLNEDRHELIRGRFFTQEFRLQGIRTFDELKQCLSQYDQCQFPEGGLSYTQFFLGDVVPDDWKLSSLAGVIWAEFNEHFMLPLKLKSWPMQYFVAMVRVLLTDFLPRYGIEDDEQILSMIFESIHVSGLVKNLVKKVS